MKPQQNKTKGRVCHFTSGHSPTDTRVFLKECRSLARAGYETYLISPWATETVVDGVHLFGLGETQSGRWRRLGPYAWRVFKKAQSLNADIYHFHDPGLLPLAWLLAKEGRKVIYDAHEDLPRQTLIKDYIPMWLRPLMASSSELIEDQLIHSMAAIVGATPTITERFARLHPNTVNVNNYPISTEFESAATDWSKKERSVCYVGLMDEARGFFEIVDSLQYTDGQIYLGGTINADFMTRAKTSKHWTRAKALGFIDREKMADVLSKCMAGLVLFHPSQHHFDALPNKMFEYMSAGIPVIASDFPLWKEIIADQGCGLCVDPQNPKAIADAINWIFEHPKEAEVMGRKGQEMVRDRLNWEIEEKKLLALYAKLISKK